MTIEVTQMLSVTAAGVTDRGQSSARPRNEDSYIIDKGLGLYVVADGMGGYNGGLEASKLTCDTVRGYVRAFGHEGERLEMLKLAIRMANANVRGRASQNVELAQMGTTFVGLIDLGGGSVGIAHVGDSRCYRYRDGRIEQLAADHNGLTVLDRVIDEEFTQRGIPVPDYVLSYRRGEKLLELTHAIGPKPDVELTTRVEQLQSGDIFLLCSDGLTGMLSNEEIARAIALGLALGLSLEAICEELVCLANERGGVDNITVVLVSYGELSKSAVLAEPDILIIDETESAAAE